MVELTISYKKGLGLFSKETIIALLFYDLSFTFSYFVHAAILTLEKWE